MKLLMLFVALLLAGCAAQQAHVAAVPGSADDSECDLSVADALKIAPNDIHKMTDAEFKGWSDFAGKHGYQMQSDMSAWVVPHTDPQDDDGVLVGFHGCIVLFAHDFTPDQMKRIFRGEDIDGDDQQPDDKGPGI